ncbi:hypothetical protein JY446_24875, partial [Serratia marcescens]|uniref:hypothetical protein n=1 Tax=Serratia marcescens TaxID=615 RepID=UPI001E13E193|nr:hypothetical protein [Serratia marcescens]
VTGGFMTKSLKEMLAELAVSKQGNPLQDERTEDNLARISLAAEAVLAFLARCPGDERDVTSIFADLMADLFHLGHRLHMAGFYADFPLWRQSVLLTAMGHFDAEITEFSEEVICHPHAAFALLSFLNSRKQPDQHISVSARLLATELVMMNTRLESLPKANALAAVIAEIYK